MKTVDRGSPGIWGSLGWLMLFFVLQGLTSMVAGAIRATEVGPENVVLDAQMGVLLGGALLISGAAIIALRHKHLLAEITPIVGMHWWKVASLLFLGLIGINLAYDLVILGDRYSQPEMQIFIDGARTGIIPSFIIIMAIVVVAPIAEEILFRGQLQPAVEKRFGPWPAIIGPAILFGAVHLQPWAAPPLIIAGIFLGWLRWKTGSLLAPITFHIIMNALAMTIMISTGQVS